MSLTVCMWWFQVTIEAEMSIKLIESDVCFIWMQFLPFEPMSNDNDADADGKFLSQYVSDTLFNCRLADNFLRYSDEVYDKMMYYVLLAVLRSFISGCLEIKNSPHPARKKEIIIRFYFLSSCCSFFLFSTPITVFYYTIFSHKCVEIRTISTNCR